jgi:cytoskeletal protein CcmA (bactofilin family)
MSGVKNLFAKDPAKASSSSEEISAFLGKETAFEGKMTFRGVFRLDGRFDGEIFESGTLIVGEDAQVKGKIEAGTIVIHGLVEGEVVAGKRVEIHSTGRFYGTLLTRSLVVSDGGILDGTCRMEPPPQTGELEPASPYIEAEEEPLA